MCIGGLACVKRTAYLVMNLVITWREKNALVQEMCEYCLLARLWLILHWNSSIQINTVCSLMHVQPTRFVMKKDEQLLFRQRKHWLVSVEAECWLVRRPSSEESALIWLRCLDSLVRARISFLLHVLPASDWSWRHVFSCLSPPCGYIVLYGSCSQSQRVRGLHHGGRFFWLV